MPDGPEDLAPEAPDPVESEVGTALVPARGRALAPADPFRRYIAEARRYPSLSREEEQELARRYRATGDRDALFRLVTSNLMLVVRVALSFRRAARNLLDLVQEGNVGLLQAIDRFDPELGVRLPTYATWWVRAYMVKFLLDNVRLVRVGTTNARRRLLHNLRDEQRRLEERGFEAGPRLLAERFGVSEEDVRDVQNALASHDVSLDAPAGDGDDRSRADVLAADAPDVEAEVARRELQERTQAALVRFRADLGERERTILDERILADEPLTLQALGDRFGTTREAVRQAEARLMGRLKTFLRAELPDLASIRIGPD
jgi:RNA polymerase sigma-32 factor